MLPQNPRAWAGGHAASACSIGMHGTPAQARMLCTDFQLPPKNRCCLNGLLLHRYSCSVTAILASLAPMST
jgi:hypothetical protein